MDETVGSDLMVSGSLAAYGIQRVLRSGEGTYV